MRIIHGGMGRARLYPFREDGGKATAPQMSSAPLKITCSHLQLYFRHRNFPNSRNSFQLPSCNLDTLTFFIKIREMLCCANCNQFYTFWLTQIFSMFSKQRKFQSSQKVTHFRVWLKKNRRKTKKWFVSFKFDWILVMKSYKFNFYHFSLHDVVHVVVSTMPEVIV